MNKDLFRTLKVALQSDSVLLTESAEGLLTTSSFNVPASPAELEEVLDYCQGLLPQAYQAFLRLCNGCTLFKLSNIDGFQFFGCRELIAANEWEKAQQPQWSENIILFCSCLGDGDYLGFRMVSDTAYELLDCYHEELPTEWKSFGGSFEGFVEQLVAGKGHKYWLQEDSQ